jgi:HNH endonuclease
MISETLRLQVRQRANFACEYCGVTETDSGGELTLDHYQPQSQNGTDELNNLIYCCSRCNSYKSDYWPTNKDEMFLWNPRQESRDKHFLLLANGQLHTRTKKGNFTLQHLRFNRPALVAYRLEKLRSSEQERQFLQLQNYIKLLQQLEHQYVNLLDKQRELLERQEILLNELIKQNKTQK